MIHEGASWGVGIMGKPVLCPVVSCCRWLHRHMFNGFKAFVFEITRFVPQFPLFTFCDCSTTLIHDTKLAIKYPVLLLYYVHSFFTQRSTLPSPALVDNSGLDSQKQTPTFTQINQPIRTPTTIWKDGNLVLLHMHYLKRLPVERNLFRMWSSSMWLLPPCPS